MCVITAILNRTDGIRECHQCNVVNIVLCSLFIRRSMSRLERSNIHEENDSAMKSLKWRRIPLRTVLKYDRTCRAKDAATVMDDIISMGCVTPLSIDFNIDASSFSIEYANNRGQIMVAATISAVISFIIEDWQYV
mmetsp:Transcript_41030/g.47956  ORF Transcript_41030/g.47956 Transcript_41030/m.47956 type:complete len:136 (-) Transcript_41030:1043-1450(-)